MKAKILLIDGSSLLASNFYGTAPNGLFKCDTEEEREIYYQELMQTSSHIYTNAVYGMTKDILKAISQFKPTHIAVAFDESRETTFRRQMYSEYKAQRKDSPLALKEQIGTMEKMLDAMGITHLSSPTYEADDLVASMVKKYEHENEDVEIYVWTKDRDYYQLASKKTTLWMMQSNTAKADELFNSYQYIYDYNEYIPGNCAFFTDEIVKLETGVRPEQIPDLKGVMGDTSDNIPGIPGVATPAPKLISLYGTIEKLIDTCVIAEQQKTIPKLTAFWKRCGILRPPIKKILEGKDIGILSKTLATMKTDCEVPDLTDIALNFNETGYQDYKKTLEFRSI